MKRTILLTAVLLFISTATAVVGGPEPDEGEMAIMSGGSSSASGSVAAGPNGTEWRATVEMAGRNPNSSAGDNVGNISYAGNQTTFTGQIQAPTPCHVLEQEVEKLDGQNYRINIQTVKDDLDNETGVCAQQVVMINYDGSFETGAPYKLEVQHNNQTVETLQNGEINEETKKQNNGALSSFFNWLANLF